MTTSRPIRTFVLGGLRVLAICVAIFVAWVLVSAMVMLRFEPTDGSLVVLGKRMGPGDLEEGTSILWWDLPLAGLTGEDQGWVAGLYRSGALLVLPRRRRSCLSLR